MKRTFREFDGKQEQVRDGSVRLRNAVFFGDGDFEEGLLKELNQVVSGVPGELILHSGWHVSSEIPAFTTLLARLAHCDWSAASEAIHGYPRDPRTRPALVEAVRRAPPQVLFHSADLLGFAGGPGAVEALRGRLRESEDDVEGMNTPHGQPLITVVEAMLRLDPAATDAAQVLIHLFEDLQPPSRYTAVASAVSVFRRDVRTQAMVALHDAFERFLDVEDARLFLGVAHLLADAHFDAVHVRCQGLLADPSYELRQGAAVALARLPLPRMVEALATLARWAPRGEPLGLALWVGSLVGPLLSEAGVISLVRRGFAEEQAWMRMQALKLAGRLDPAATRPLLEEALRDEPEPYLQQKMSEALV